MRIRNWSILASVILHGLLVAMMLLPKRPTPAPPPPMTYVELTELHNSPGTDKTNSSPKNDVITRKKSAKLSTKPARKFGHLNLNLHSQANLRDHWLEANDPNAPSAASIATDTAIDDTTDADPITAVGPAGHGWSKGVQYGQAMKLDFVNSTLGYFQALHRKVDRVLDFPKDLARSRIDGHISVEATLSRDGRLLELTSTNADNNVLQAYALTLLIHTLKDPLPERAWLKTEKAVVVFDFEFRTRTEHGTPRTLRSGVEKNRLVFAREGTYEPWLNEKVQEVFTHYVPPIIPIPGGFYVDFVMAYQYVKNILEDAPVESEAREKRVRQLHQNLIQTIRAGAPAPNQNSAAQPTGQAKPEESTSGATLSGDRGGSPQTGSHSQQSLQGP